MPYAVDPRLNINLNEFDSDSLISGIFTYLWKIPAIQSATTFTDVSAAKDATTAEGFLQEGQDHFRNGDVFKALESFNRSIIYSPHPVVEGLSSCERDRYPTSQLSLGYANRSAVLYQLEEHEACLLDAARSIQHGCPSLMKPQLIERQIRCHVALGREERALETLEKYLAEVKAVEEAEFPVVERLRAELKSSFSSINCEKETLTRDKKSQAFQSQKLKCVCVAPAPVVPDLIERNPTVPSLSSAATISYSEEKGRHLVATRNILPGEILSIENGLHSSPDEASLHSHCTMCLNRTFTPVPCSGCTFVVFCSDVCAAEAKRLFHNVECPILPTLVKGLEEDYSCGILRFVMKMTLDGLKKNIPFYDQVKKDGFNDQNVYCSDDFRQIYNLKTNIEHRTTSDLLDIGVMTVRLVKLLQRSTFFQGSSRGMEDYDLADIVLVGKCIFTMIMVYHCNVAGVYEFDGSLDKLRKIGLGVYGVFSLANHSCNPSLVKTFFGSTLVSRAVRYIPAGAEITCLYGAHYAFANVLERQNVLNDEYFFHCRCEACSGNWTHGDIFNEIVFFSSSNVSKISSKCRAKKVTKQITEDVANADDNIKKLWLKKYPFEGKRTSTHCQLSDEDEKSLITAIHLLYLHTSLPNQILVYGQILLKTLYYYKGSRYDSS